MNFYFIFLFICIAILLSYYSTLSLTCRTDTSTHPIELSDELSLLAGDVIDLKVRVKDVVHFIRPDNSQSSFYDRCTEGILYAATAPDTLTQFMIIPIAVLDKSTSQSLFPASNSSSSPLTTQSAFISTIQLIHVDTGRILGVKRVNNVPVLLPASFISPCKNGLGDYETVFDIDSHKVDDSVYLSLWNSFSLTQDQIQQYKNDRANTPLFPFADILTQSRNRPVNSMNFNSTKQYNLNHGQPNVTFANQQQQHQQSQQPSQQLQQHSHSQHYQRNISEPSKPPTANKFSPLQYFAKTGPFLHKHTTTWARHQMMKKIEMEKMISTWSSLLTSQNETTAPESKAEFIQDQRNVKILSQQLDSLINQLSLYPLDPVYYMRHLNQQNKQHNQQQNKQQQPHIVNKPMTTFQSNRASGWTFPSDPSQQWGGQEYSMDVGNFMDNFLEKTASPTSPSSSSSTPNGIFDALTPENELLSNLRDNLTNEQFSNFFNQTSSFTSHSQQNNTILNKLTAAEYNNRTIAFISLRLRPIGRAYIINNEKNNQSDQNSFSYKNNANSNLNGSTTSPNGDRYVYDLGVNSSETWGAAGYDPSQTKKNIALDEMNPFLQSDDVLITPCRGYISNLVQTSPGLASNSNKQSQGQGQKQDEEQQSGTEGGGIIDNDKGEGDGTTTIQYPKPQNTALISKQQIESLFNIHTPPLYHLQKQHQIYQTFTPSPNPTHVHPYPHQQRPQLYPFYPSPLQPRQDTTSSPASHASPALTMPLHIDPTWSPNGAEIDHIISTLFGSNSPHLFSSIKTSVSVSDDNLLHLDSKSIRTITRALSLLADPIFLSVCNVPSTSTSATPSMSSSSAFSPPQILKHCEIFYSLLSSTKSSLFHIFQISQTAALLSPSSSYHTQTHTQTHTHSQYTSQPHMTTFSSFHHSNLQKNNPFFTPTSQPTQIQTQNLSRIGHTSTDTLINNVIGTTDSTTITDVTDITDIADFPQHQPSPLKFERQESESQESQINSQIGTTPNCRPKFSQPRINAGSHLNYFHLESHLLHQHRQALLSKSIYRATDHIFDPISISHADIPVFDSFSSNIDEYTTTQHKNLNENTGQIMSVYDLKTGKQVVVDTNTISYPLVTYSGTLTRHNSKLITAKEIKKYKQDSLAAIRKNALENDANLHKDANTLNVRSFHHNNNTITDQGVFLNTLSQDDANLIEWSSSLSPFSFFSSPSHTSINLHSTLQWLLSTLQHLTTFIMGFNNPHQPNLSHICQNSTTVYDLKHRIISQQSNENNRKPHHFSTIHHVPATTTTTTTSTSTSTSTTTATPTETGTATTTKTTMANQSQSFLPYKLSNLDQNLQATKCDTTDTLSYRIEGNTNCTNNVNTTFPNTIISRNSHMSTQSTQSVQSIQSTHHSLLPAEYTKFSPSHHQRSFFSQQRQAANTFSTRFPVALSSPPLTASKLTRRKLPGDLENNLNKVNHSFPSSHHPPSNPTIQAQQHYVRPIPPSPSSSSSSPPPSSSSLSSSKLTRLQASNALKITLTTSLIPTLSKLSDLFQNTYATFQSSSSSNSSSTSTSTSTNQSSNQQSVQVCTLSASNDGEIVCTNPHGESSPSPDSNSNSNSSPSCPSVVPITSSSLWAVSKVPFNDVPTSSLFLSQSLTNVNYDLDYAAANTYPFMLSQLMVQNFSQFEQFLSARIAKRFFTSMTFRLNGEIAPIITIIGDGFPAISLAPVANIIDTILTPIENLLTQILPNIDPEASLFPRLNQNATISLDQTNFEIPILLQGSTTVTDDNEVSMSYSITSPPNTYIIARAMAVFGRLMIPFDVSIQRQINLPPGIYGNPYGAQMSYDYSIPGQYQGSNLINNEYIIDVL